MRYSFSRYRDLSCVPTVITCSAMPASNDSVVWISAGMAGANAWLITARGAFHNGVRGGLKAKVLTHWYGQTACSHVIQQLVTRTCLPAKAVL